MPTQVKPHVFDPSLWGAKVPARETAQSSQSELSVSAVPLGSGQQAGKPVYGPTMPPTAAQASDRTAAAGPWVDVGSVVPLSQSNSAARSALPAQTEAGNAAAQAQVTVDDAREYSQNDLLRAEVQQHADSLQNTAQTEAARMEQAAGLKPGDPGYDPNRQVDVIERDGRRVMVEIVRDASGNPISQTRIVLAQEPFQETSVETVLPDAEHPGQFVHSFSHTYGEGDQTVVNEQHTSYEGRPDEMPSAEEFDWAGPAYFNQSHQAQRSQGRLEMELRDGFVSQHAQETSYDPVTRTETSSERRATFEETTLRDAGLPAGTDRAFDPNGPIVQGTVFESTTLPNGECVTKETQVTAQDNVRVTTSSQDWGPSTVTIERQTGDNTKLTQTLMEGSTESVITQTTAEGNTVSEHSRMLDEGTGGVPTLTGASDTTSVYGADGHIADRTRTTVGGGETTTEHSTRTVHGDEVSYDTLLTQQQAGGPVSSTHTSQVNHLDAEGNEVFARSQVTLPDGKQATVSEEDGETRTVSITPSSGGPAQSGHVEPSPDGGSRVVFTDPAGAQHEVSFTADGHLAEGSSFDALTPEQRSMLPLLMLGSNGFGANLQGQASGELLNTLHDGGINGSEQADVLSALATQEASNVELAQHTEPRSPLVDGLLRMQTAAGRAGTLNSIVSSVGGERVSNLAPWLKGVGGALGMFGGGVSMVSGIDNLVNPQDRYSRYEGMIDILGGGTAVFGGAATLGLIAATPPGWLLGAIGGTAMLGRWLINYRRDHGYAGMMSELIPGGSAMDPTIWNPVSEGAP